MLRLPSIKTLSLVFDDAKKAREILEMSRTQLIGLPAGSLRVGECLHAPKTYDIRLHCLNAIDSGLFGIENLVSACGSYASYLNTGDSYTPTLIYWDGQYRVQSIGDFVEKLERQNVHFN